MNWFKNLSHHRKALVLLPIMAIVFGTIFAILSWFTSAFGPTAIFVCLLIFLTLFGLYAVARAALIIFDPDHE